MSNQELWQRLALLYLENQDIAKLSPEELCDEYTKVFNRIKKHQTKDRTPQRIG